MQEYGEGLTHEEFIALQAAAFEKFEQHQKFKVLEHEKDRQVKVTQHIPLIAHAVIHIYIHTYIHTHTSL